MTKIICPKCDGTGVSDPIAYINCDMCGDGNLRGTGEIEDGNEE